jgi:hypothetical protein
MQAGPTFLSAAAHAGESVGSSVASKEMQQQSYIDIQYLSTFGLFRANALEYFYTSPFFDPNSNNQRLRTQGVHPEQHLSILQTMTGLEFVLDEHNTCEPNLFVFRKQNRWSPKRADLIDVYYCTDGIIYQCPDLLNLLKSRLAKAAFYLEQSFETTRRGVRWVDAAVGKRRKSGFVCWKESQEEGNAAVEKETAAAEAAGKEEIDNFHVKKRARSKIGKKYEKFVRDLPTFKGPLSDVSL